MKPLREQLIIRPSRVPGACTLRLALVLAALAANGCREREVPPTEHQGEAPRETADSLACLQRQLTPGDLTGWNLLFVTFDTTRADHLGCYGYATAQTPTIDRLAATGAIFDHAVAPVSATLPSHCTMMTGLEAPNHGVRTNGHFNLRKDKTTLAEVLRDYGYATAAFVATYVLNHRFGMSQGFDTYDDERRSDEPESDDRLLPRRADYQTDVAIKWLTRHLDSRSRQPFFMWVHYFDPHLPHDPPGEYGKRFADKPYDGEIAYADHHLRRLLDFLETNQLLDSTLIVLTADHGEGLFEHLEKDHSRLIYDTTMHVPLIINCPQLHDDPCRIDDITVGLIDIMPTVLSLLGIDAGLTMDGFNLLTAKVDPHRVIYIETIAGLLYHGWASLHGLRSIDKKFIKAPLPEFYDLKADPGELRNLLETNGHVADELAAKLEEIMSAWPPVEAVARTTDRLNKRVAKNLAALGYVSTRTPGDTVDRVRPDPKDMVPLFEDLRKKTAAEIRELSWNTVRSGGPDDASNRRGLILARAAAKRKPDDSVFLTTLALALYRTAAYVDAIETLQRLDRNPSPDEKVYAVYATACRVMSLQRLGRLDQATAAMMELRSEMEAPWASGDETARALLTEAASIVDEH